MIGLATTFFWIFLIAFFVSAVYSLKDVHFDFGDPQTNLTSDNKFILSIPVSIINKGFYDIDSFNMSTEVFDREGLSIARGSTFIPIITKNASVTVTHNMTIDINDLLERYQDYLFNDTEVKIHEVVGMKIGDMVPLQASANFSVPWGAPLYNFTLGKAEYAAHNLTHFRAVVPVSFENHAPFDVVGTIQTRMYNSADEVIGNGQTSIEAYHNSPYNGYLELYVPITGITESGRFEIYFQTLLFNYGPLVISYG
jgi:hypothetical protein